MERRENNGTSKDPVGTFSGDFRFEFTDVAIAGRGPTPTFTRSYDSAETRVGRLGPGWTDNYATRLRKTGDGSDDLFFVGGDGNTDRYTHNPDDTFSPPPAVFRTLVQNADSTYTATEMNQMNWSFDGSGNLTGITDRFGNTSILTYNGQDQLISVSDPAGRGSLALAYTDGRLTSVTDWASPPRTVTYEYDPNGRLWKVTNREGQTVAIGYDGTSQRLTTITDARQHVAVTMTYDALGRVSTQKDARGLLTGSATTFAYVVNGDGSRVTTVTYPPASFAPSFLPTAVDSYNAQGWMTRRVSRTAPNETQTESYGYDATGNLISTTDPRGFTSNYCFDVSYAGIPIPGSRGNMTRLIQPAPAAGAVRPVSLFAFDGQNNATQVVTARGVPSGATVTCSTNLSAINSLYATDMAYDPSGALVSTTSRFTDPDSGPQVAVTKIEYGDSANPGRVTRSIPARGNTGPSPDYSYATSFVYGASGSQAGLLASTTDPLGNTVTTEYDAVGRITTVVDQLGNAAGGVPAEHTTAFVYDNEDRVRFRTSPAPQLGGSPLVSETRYDAAGNPTVQIDANGQVTMSTYDERDSLSQVRESPAAWTDPLSPPAEVITTEYTYDDSGNLSRITRAKGDPGAERVVDYLTDSRGLGRRETQYPFWPATAPTLVTTSTYDSNGNLTVAVDPLGRSTTSTYDRLNRRTKLDYSGSATADVTFGFDAYGNRTSMTDGTGTTSYAYDEADRLTSVVSPGAKTVGYRYDLEGNRTRLIYPDLTAVTYTYNMAGQLVSLQDWASRSVSYTYWPDGALKTSTNPDASVASYAYDNDHRVTDILHERAGSTIGHYAYALDAIGNVAGLQDGVDSSTYGYDHLYRLTNVAGPDGARTYGYDPVGNRTSLVAGGTTTYAYDRADRITSLQGPLAPASVIRPPSSNATGWAAPSKAYVSDNVYATAAPGKNATTTVNLGNFNFDAAIPANATITGVTVTVEWKVSTTSSNATLGAQVAVNGTPVGTELINTSEPLSDLSQSFSVPGLTRAQLLNSTFKVRVRATRDSSITGFTASLDAVSVKVDYTGSAGVTITSDGNGNTTAKGADTYTYDQANQLKTATVSGATETYTYDGDGVRFSRMIGAAPPMRYVSDVNASLPLTLDDGTRKYVYGLGLAFAVSGTTLEIYHTDRLGSVRAITDASGALIASYRTDEFGIQVASTGASGQPYGFTGEPRDATGLVFMRARYYDPSLGRFINRDTWAGMLESPATLDHYAYVAANPLTLSDPSGRWWPHPPPEPSKPPKANVLSGINTAGYCVTTAIGGIPRTSFSIVCGIADQSGAHAILLINGYGWQVGYNITPFTGGILTSNGTSVTDQAGNFSEFTKSWGPFSVSEATGKNSKGQIIHTTITSGGGLGIGTPALSWTESYTKVVTEADQMKIYLYVFGGTDPFAIGSSVLAGN